MAFAEAVNNQEYEKATSFFAEDAVFQYSDNVYDLGLDSWIEEAKEGKDFYKFSEFAINADSVEFKWFFRYMLPWETEKFEQEMCEGNATMEEDKIIYLKIAFCK